MFDSTNVSVMETVGDPAEERCRSDRVSTRHRLQLIDLGALRQVAHRPVDVESPSVSGEASPVMRGIFSIQCLRVGVHLHCTDIVNLQPLITRTEVAGPCVKVMLRLEGGARVRIGGRDLPLGAGQGAKAVPKGVVLSLDRDESFERRSAKGDRQRMIVITLAPEWLDSLRSSPCPLSGHLAIQTWVPTPRSVAIVEQLLNPPTFAGPMHGLYLESRVLELVAEAFAQTVACTQASVQSTSPDLRPEAYARARRLRELLDSGRVDEMSLSDMARKMRCNASTLQQQFRLAFGKTIFDYLRSCRLQRAALALQHDGVSVARAAEIAGYSSQANFSTAFRRHFGLPPKRYRARV